MKDCLFCNLRNGIIFENEFFYSVFDVHPVSPGHALVIPKNHRVSLLDLDKNEWIFLRETIKETIILIEKSNFKDLYEKMALEKITENSVIFSNKMLNHFAINKIPEGYNIGNNDGKVAGRTIHHLHIQIIPRFKGDVKDPTGGIRTIIPELGNYLK